MTKRLTKAEKERLEKQHEREVLVSRGKLVLIFLCLIAIPVTFLVNHSDIGGVRDRVTRIESPCVRYGSDSKICQEAFETAVHSINHRIACFIDRKSGRPFKPSCRGVRLRIESNKAVHADSHNGAGDQTPSELQTNPNSGIGNGGDAETTPPTGNSTPAPGNGGNQGGGQGNGGSGGSPAPSTPTPSQPSQPSAPAPSSSSNSSSSSGGAPTSPPADVPAEPNPGVVEEVGAAANEVTQGVNEVVEGAGGVVCGLTAAVQLPCK